MIPYLSLIGLVIAFIGAFLPVFTTLFPKIGIVSIFRNYFLKRISLFIVGCLFIALDVANAMNNISSTELVIMYSLLLVFGLISVGFNQKFLLRAIANPIHYSIEDSAKFSITDDELVMGYVSDDSTAVAWPLKKMVKPRHLINDTVSGKPILVTYCPLCRSGLIFDPVLNSKRSIFIVAGLYRRNMIMLDSNTKTIWQQATGLGINGKLKGTELPMLPYEICTWKGWKTEHPKTTLAWELKKNIGVRIIHRVFQTMFERPKMPIFPGITKLGKDLPLQEEIIGIHLDLIYKAYPITVLKEKKVLKDKIGSITIQIEYNDDFKSVKIWQVGDTKQPLPAERHSWLSWKEFHPNTSLYIS